MFPLVNAPTVGPSDDEDIPMIARLKFLLNRLHERLWVKPLVACALSIVGVMLAKAVGWCEIFVEAPLVTTTSIETLLAILSASMLVIATFAVGSMVTSYGTASTIATPRAFPLVVADDVSQNALSIFIGAFIFSVVANIAVKNGFYERAGRFVLFLLTAMVFTIVILTFVRWVDRIARLGRLSAIIEKVEKAAASALAERRIAPTLQSQAVGPRREGGQTVCAGEIGYVQRINVAALQNCAKDADARVTIEALPGTFTAPGRPLAYVVQERGGMANVDVARIRNAFIVGRDRTFDEDPRFGLVVLAQIAGRALSPAVNDPGTAIDITGAMVRLLARWVQPLSPKEKSDCLYDRVEASEVGIGDMFDDAFTAISRDGAGTVEVVVRLLKALHSLAECGDPRMREAAQRHARLALARAEHALTLPEDLATVRALAEFASAG